MRDELMRWLGIATFGVPLLLAIAFERLCERERKPDPDDRQHALRIGEVVAPTRDSEAGEAQQPAAHRGGESGGAEADSDVAKHVALHVVDGAPAPASVEEGVA